MDPRFFYVTNSSRSKCCHCKEKINAKIVCLISSHENKRGERTLFWHHLSCAFEKGTLQFSDDYSKIRGYNDLSDSYQLDIAYAWEFSGD